MKNQVTGTVIFGATLAANDKFAKEAYILRLDLGYVNGAKIIGTFKTSNPEYISELKKLWETREHSLPRLRFSNVRLRPVERDGELVFGKDQSLNMDIVRNTLHKPIGIKRLKDVSTEIRFS